ncbi:MAG: PEP-CTERM sorting domain-containing protein [Scytonema sp. RU_4_4]|nr:PEP-CTERM sorting domain-containing protein [Scytonema sp. RU_4_4]
MLISVMVIDSSTLVLAANSNFNFSYAPGTSLEQMIGFEMAGGVWSNNLADSVTVNIYVETTDQLPKYVISGALPAIQANQSYETWRNKLKNDLTSADDNLAFKNLQSDEQFTALSNGQTTDENEQLNMTRANAKALGMRDSNDSMLDGYILINNLSSQPVEWNYDFLNNTVPSNTVDLLSVAIHEIGHNLGFVSGVDEPGFLINVLDDDDDDGDDDENEELHVTSLDIFRYSTKSASAGAIDMSVGGNPFFSIDSGKTVLGYFSTGENTSLGGDGYQASHWKQQDNPLGIMDPLLRPGQRRDILMLDKQVMDVIGWNLHSGETDLATLYNQAKARLAQRLGKTVEWLDANPIEAASLLTQDRTLDVQTMIDQSKVYNWRGGSGSGWWQNGLF